MYGVRTRTFSFILEHYNIQGIPSVVDFVDPSDKVIIEHAPVAVLRQSDVPYYMVIIIEQMEQADGTYFFFYVPELEYKAYCIGSQDFLQLWNSVTNLISTSKPGVNPMYIVNAELTKQFNTINWESLNPSILPKQYHDLFAEFNIYPVKSTKLTKDIKLSTPSSIEQNLTSNIMEDVEIMVNNNHYAMIAHTDKIVHILLNESKYSFDLSFIENDNERMFIGIYIYSELVKSFGLAEELTPCLLPRGMVFNSVTNWLKQRYVNTDLKLVNTSKAIMKYNKAYMLAVIASANINTVFVPYTALDQKLVTFKTMETEPYTGTDRILNNIVEYLGTSEEHIVSFLRQNLKLDGVYTHIMSAIDFSAVRLANIEVSTRNKTKDKKAKKIVKGGGKATKPLTKLQVKTIFGSSRTFK